jgi:hypothetical protein
LLEPDLSAAAMALAIELSGQQRLAAADRPVTASWLFDDLDAVPYERPSGTDAEGFVTVGEQRDLRFERTDFVLVQPETRALRIAWSNDFGN